MVFLTNQHVCTLSNAVYCYTQIIITSSSHERHLQVTSGAPLYVMEIYMARYKDKEKKTEETHLHRTLQIAGY